VCVEGTEVIDECVVMNKLGGGMRDTTVDESRYDLTERGRLKRLTSVASVESSTKSEREKGKRKR
jgi:hypothetical protein